MGDDLPFLDEGVPLDVDLLLEALGEGLLLAGGDLLEQLRLQQSHQVIDVLRTLLLLYIIKMGESDTI